MALTSLMKCDSSHTVTLSMQTTTDGDKGQKNQTILERALGTTKAGGPNRRKGTQNSKNRHIYRVTKKTGKNLQLT